MLALRSLFCEETRHERGTILPEVLISLGILMSCTSAMFSHLARTARALDSLEKTHRARFEVTMCSTLRTHVACQLGTTSITIVR